MECGESYPEDPSLRCFLTQSHAEHAAWREPGDYNTAVFWSNSDYKPPVTPTHVMAQKVALRELASRVRHGDTERAGAVARWADPETSHEAACSLGDLTDAQTEVLELFQRFGAMIDEGVEQRARQVGVRQTVSGLRTRRLELCDAGLLRWSGEWSLNQRGNRSRVWELVPSPVLSSATDPEGVKTQPSGVSSADRLSGNGTRGA